MKGMWELPMVEVGRFDGLRASKDSRASRRRAQAAIRKHLREAGIPPGSIKAAGSVRHTITNHRIAVEIFEVSTEGPSRRTHAERPGPLRGEGGRRERAPEAGGLVRGLWQARGAVDLAGSGGGETRWVPLASLGDLALGGIARKIVLRLGLTLPGSGRASSAR